MDNKTMFLIGAKNNGRKNNSKKIIAQKNNITMIAKKNNITIHNITIHNITIHKCIETTDNGGPTRMARKLGQLLRRVTMTIDKSTTCTKARDNFHRHNVDKFNYLLSTKGRPRR